MKKKLFYCLFAGVTVVAASGQTPSYSVLPPITDGIRAPARVAATSEGNILVSEPGLGRVDVLDSFGRSVGVRDGLGTPLSLAVDSTGLVYVGDQRLGSVSVYDAQWNLAYKLGAGDHEFGLPGALAVGSPSNTPTVYVCDSAASRVSAYQQGQFAFSFGNYGTNQGQFDFPCALYISPNRELFVLDQNNDRVEVFNLNGAYLRQFTLATYDTSGMFAPRRSGRPLGLTGDTAGRIYVADGFQGDIKIFSAQGAFLGSMTGSAAAPFRTPSGMVVDGNNRLLVAMANGEAVGVIGLDSYLGLTVSPPARVVAAGTNASFSVTAGGGPFTFQWRKGSANLTDGDRVSGSLGPVLELSALTAADSGGYSVVLTGPSGTSVSSSECLLTVLNRPVIAVGPTNATLLEGSAATFTVVAQGDALQYQWQFDGNDIAGATSQVLSIERATSVNVGRYQVRVSNAVGTLISSPATLDVVVPPASPILQPISFGTNQLPGLTVLVQPNQSYSIETSTNLFDWVVLTNLYNETGTIEVVDPSGSPSGQRFYRVRWTQP